MSSAAMACAVSAATAIMPGVCSGQVAADYATDPTYSGGWAATQNGGYGFGAWSFNGTDPTPPGTYQAMSSSAPVGTAWTLLTHSGGSHGTGLANAGRGINGGLLPGQTFETVIENPTTWQGTYAYRGFDILFSGGPDNNNPGVNTAALRLQVFDYFNSAQNWKGTEIGTTTNNFGISLTGPTTGAQGVYIDLTLTSATTYSVTMSPLNGATPFTHAGTLAGPISWVDFRSYNGASSGLTDTANNYEIKYMTIVPEPSIFALIGMGSAGLLFLRRRK
jgi:hypothetical protein